MNIAYIRSCIIEEIRLIQNDFRAFETIRFSRTSLTVYLSGYQRQRADVWDTLPSTVCTWAEWITHISPHSCQLAGNYSRVFGREEGLQDYSWIWRSPNLCANLLDRVLIRVTESSGSDWDWAWLTSICVRLQGSWRQNTSSSSRLPEQTEDKWICVATNRLTLNSTFLPLYYGWNKKKTRYSFYCVTLGEGEGWTLEEKNPPPYDYSETKQVSKFDLKYLLIP